MKDGIHPNYAEATFTCACGNVIKTQSTRGSSIMTDICSNCHPFYTGKQKLSTVGGRIEKFHKKYQKTKQA